ncbi:helix-turn-helix domain-containing protein, partial [Staphylococcus chromogenes]
MLHFNLKTYLKNKGMTISELSELTGISRNSLGLLVNGRSRGIQFDTLEKISRVIDVSINELFTISFDEIQIRTVLNNVRSSDIGINSRATYDDKILICSIDIDGKVYDFYFPYVISIKMNVLKTAESELHIKLHITEYEFYRLF